MEMYAEIIPLIRLPASMGIFDYIVPKELSFAIRKGSIVEIPFRKKLVYGVVVKIKHTIPRGSFRIKKIQKITDNELVPPHHIQLGFWLSEHYIQSSALIFKNMLPKIPKRIPTVFPKHNRPQKLVSASENTKSANPFFQSQKILFIGKKTPKTLYDLVRWNIQNRKQVLILFPEISQMESLVKTYTNNTGKKPYALITSQISDKKLFTQWKEIRSNRIQLVLGTRKAVFAPFSNLGLIIVEREQDPSLKQWDQNPRYHALDVAIQLAKLNSAKIIIKTIAPKTQTFSKIFKDFSFITDPFPRPRIELVDMRDEIKNRNYSKISEQMRKELDNLAGQAILLINRKGSASFVLCRDCGYIPRCSVCTMPYAYHQSSPDLACNNCKTSTLLPSSCPVCGNTHFSFGSPGTQAMMEKIKNYFPHYTIERFDSDRTKKDLKDIIARFLQKKIKIIVATQAIFGELDETFSVDLFGILSADTFLGIPDYQSGEKTWQMIISALAYSKTCVIQTYHPEHYSIQCAVYMDYTAFYRQELAMRKKFSYPPFSKLIKIIFQRSNAKETEHDANTAVQQLIKLSSAASKQEIEILGPIPSSRIAVRGRYRFIIVIKIKNPAFDVSTLASAIPTDAIIDVDPIDFD